MFVDYNVRIVDAKYATMKRFVYWQVLVGFQVFYQFGFVVVEAILDDSIETYVLAVGGLFVQQELYQIEIGIGRVVNGGACRQVGGVFGTNFTRL